MKSMKPLAGLLLAASMLRADGKLVEVKYANPNVLRDLVMNFGVSIRSDDKLKALVLAGPPEALALAEAAIHKLDVPQPPDKDVELIAYLVMASNEAQSGAEPADLAPAIKQMRTLFPYKSYRLLETIWVRSQSSGHFESGGLLPVSLRTDPNFNATYLLSGRPSIIPGEPNIVRIVDLNLALTLREKTTVKIGSSIDVREGQKVVIGKTNPTGGDGAVVLIVTVKVVD